MSCETARRLESDALDRMLPDDVENEFNKHLAVCTACRVHYQQLARLQATLRQSSRALPPPDLEMKVRALWHPTLRPTPTLRLYPYLKGYLTWDLRRLRFLGHMAGFFLTTVTFLLTLASFGKLPFKDGRFSGPGIYTHMTRPTPTEVTYWGDIYALPLHDLQADYLHANLSVGASRMSDEMLSRFADGEREATHEDSLSVITSMDSTGRSAIEGVLHSPRDPKLFVRFGQLLSTSQFDLPGPLSSSRTSLVRSFSRIFVTG